MTATLSPLWSRPRPMVATRAVVMEHDGALRGFFAQVLRREGLDVTEAAHAEDLVSAALDGEEPDVIFCDVSSDPDGAGEALRRLRESGCPALLVLLSDHDDLEAAYIAARLGASLLEKPFGLSQLRAYARMVLGQARS